MTPHALPDTPTMTQARREQLDFLKQRRRLEAEKRARELQQARIVQPLDKLCLELRRIAMGGVMPRVEVFDRAKPASWATAHEHCRCYGLTWTQLAQEAGLFALEQAAAEGVGG